MGVSLTGLAAGCLALHDDSLVRCSACEILATVSPQRPSTRQHIDQLLNAKDFTRYDIVARQLKALLEVSTSLRERTNDNQTPQSWQANDASATPNQEVTCLDPADIDAETHPGLACAGSNQVKHALPPWLARRRAKKRQ